MGFTRHSIREGIPWLELLFATALMTLLFQIFPSLWRWAVWAIDVRHWSRAVWIGANFGVILILIGIRFRGRIVSGRSLLSAIRRLRATPAKSAQTDIDDSDYELRTQRDAEWRARATKRLPFT